MKKTRTSSPQHVLCCMIYPHELYSAVVRVHRYPERSIVHTISTIESPYYSDGIICDTTHISRLFQQLAQQYNHGKPLPLIATIHAQHPGLREAYHATQQPTFSCDRRTWHLQELLLWPDVHEHEQNHYRCALQLPMLLQWTLLMQTLAWPVHMITSQTMSMIWLYKQMCGSTFRAAHLSDKLSEYQYQAEQLVDPSLAYQFLYATPAAQEWCLADPARTRILASTVSLAHYQKVSL